MPYQDLFDFDKVGSLNPEVLNPEEIYRRELATVFARSWLFLTHESQLPKPGGFATAGGAYECLSELLRAGHIGARHFCTRWAELLDGDPLTPALPGPAPL
jgi:hypothetical protein